MNFLKNLEIAIQMCQIKPAVFFLAMVFCKSTLSHINDFQTISYVQNTYEALQNGLQVYLGSMK